MAVIIGSGTHDAAARLLVSGRALGRSGGRALFDNVSTFRVFRTRHDTDRAKLSSTPVWVIATASLPVSGFKMGCVGPCSASWPSSSRSYR